MKEKRSTEKRLRRNTKKNMAAYEMALGME